MLSADHVAGPVALMRAVLADETSGGHLPPLYLPVVSWDEMPEHEHDRVKARLREDQRRRDAEARRQGRDPLAEAISAHLAACARLGQRPLIETW